MAKMTFEEWFMTQPWHHRLSPEQKEYVRVAERDAWIASEREMESELSALRETQIPLLKRAASMLAMLADRDTKGRRTIDEFADELNEMRLRLEKTPPSALRETQKAREAAVLKLAAVHFPHTDMQHRLVCDCGLQVGSAGKWYQHICSLKPDSALDDLLREARREALDANMPCGHPQRYRTGIAGKTDAEWLQMECDECLVCERGRLIREARLAEAEWWFDSWDGEQIHGCSERLAALRAPLEPEGK